MLIEVVPYKSEWPQRFTELRSELEEILQGVPYVGIEHVGSTSVPGLAAKPIIDIDIVAKEDQMQGVIDALSGSAGKGGYRYMTEWLESMPDRHAFRKREHPIKHNLYACPEGCLALRNHLGVRRVLRGDDELRDKYGNLKLELTKRDWTKGDEYTYAKTEVLAEILKKAGMTEDEIEFIGNIQ